MQKTEQQRYWASVVKLVVEYTRRKYPIMINKVSSEIHTRKNALLYRWAAVWWHVALVERTLGSARSRAQQQEDQGGLREFLRSNLYYGSYLFDDTVFNLLSMFDYLAGLIGLVLTENLGKWLKWNALVKTIRDNDHGHSAAASLTLDVNAKWVDKLAHYRAGVYHKRADPGSVEYLEGPAVGEIQVDFLVPPRALRDIPIFKGVKKVGLGDGLRQIASKSDQDQLEVLAAFLRAEEGWAPAS